MNDWCGKLLRLLIPNKSHVLKCIFLKIKNYISNQAKRGLSLVTPTHCACCFLIRNMKHEKMIQINTEWFNHVQECGIQDQISFFFVKQLFNDCIYPFTELPY